MASEMSSSRRFNNRRRNEVVQRVQLLSAAVAVALSTDEDEAVLMERVAKRRRVHECWMAPYLYARTDASQRNTMAKLESDFLRLGCHGAFRTTTRMPPLVYKELLDRLTPLIGYKDTNFRKCVTPEERLSLTIRYLTRGDSVTTLAQSYLVGTSTVLPIIQDTCRAIYACMHEQYLKPPTTREEWLAVSQLFHDRWNMPHVLGSLDGKHIRIVKPKKSGSLYWNYKNFYSVVLFALVDADYNFLYVDVGSEGRSGDSTIWKYSAFAEDIKKPGNPLGIPEPADFPGYRGKLHYYFVADDAFEMDMNLMKPYPSAKLTMPQRIFNYRLSRARRIVENAFGILATRFRILRREIEMEPENANVVVMACVVLHNYLRAKAAAAYVPKEATDWEDRDYRQHRGVWRGEATLPGGEPNVVRNRKREVKQMRNNLADWCLTKEGELRHQYNVVLRHDFYFTR